MTDQNVTADNSPASEGGDSGLIPFQVDQGIIQHLVFNQGSDVEKALIELIMNSIDANATRVEMFMNMSGFYCKDNGSGFKTAEDIKRCFETFGTPHEDGDAKYGRFRLGRGQIMSFASTRWQTNTWQMTVDVKEGMGFRLSTLETPVEGCHIYGQWYKPLESWQLQSLLQRIRRNLRYIPIEMNINGETFGGADSGETWTFEDENAYYRIERHEGSFAIYNMGVFVMNRSVAGLGGVIVSKKALSLNTSRTAIMREHCTVWSEIENTVAELGKGIKQPWTKERKNEAFSMIMAGHPDALELIRDAPLISLVGSGNAISIGSLMFGGKYSPRRRHDPKYSGYTLPLEGELPVAEMVASLFPKIAVIHPSVLYIMGIGGLANHVDTDTIFREKMKKIHDFILDNAEDHRQVCRTGSSYHGLSVFSRMCQEAHDYGLGFDGAAFKSLSDKVDMSSQIVKAAKALKGEPLRLWGAFKRPLKQYADLLRSDLDLSIVVGESQTAEAWTDGETYIAFSTKVINALARSPLNQASRMFYLLEHELMHCVVGCGSSSTGVEHDLDFYKGFHDNIMQMASTRQIYIRRALKSYRAGLRTRKIATMKVVQDKKDEAAGRLPRETFDWEKRSAPQIPELADADALANYDIIVLRMALARDYDKPLEKDEIDGAKDLLTILSHEARIKSQGKKIDIDAAITSAIDQFAQPEEGNKEETVRAIAASIASVGSKMYSDRIFETIRAMALTNTDVFQTYRNDVFSYSWDRFVEELPASEIVDGHISIRTQVNHPSSPLRSRRLLLSAFERFAGYDQRFSRNTCASDVGYDIIGRVSPPLAAKRKIITLLSEKLFEAYHGKVPPLSVITQQAQRVMNCIDFREEVMKTIMAYRYAEEQEELENRFFEEMANAAESDEGFED